MDYQHLSGIDNATILIKNQIANFLDDHLDEYSDNILNIHRGLDFALSKYPHQGGFVLLAKDRDTILGAVVVCQTGMEGFVSENLLVYMAVHRDHRRLGIGKTLMEKTLERAKGDIALHVDPQNPAMNLYKSMGFRERFTEMRLRRQRRFHGILLD